jgi:hypothetical protein
METDTERLGQPQQRRWRWLDEKGRAMTNWSDGPPPPGRFGLISDHRGVMCVEFESEKTDPMPIARDLPVDSVDHRSCDVCDIDGVDMIEIRGGRACHYCGNSVILCPGCSIRMVQESRL